MIKKAINKYANFVSNHAVLVFILVLLFTGIMLIGNTMIQNKTMDYEEMLPEGYDVIRAFDLISQDFGSAESGMIVITIDNSYKNSNEARFVCDPEIIAYSKKLENYLERVDGIKDVNGIGNLVYSHYGKIPNLIEDARVVCKAEINSNIISDDESMEVITLTFEDGINSEKVTEEVYEVINNIDKPEGIKVAAAGNIFTEKAVMDEIGPSMQSTSTFAMIAIIAILFFMFRNIKHVAIPLMTIIFGVLWTTGFMGWTGNGMTTMTSGAVSMIMGIGIDFGIQILVRFKYEKKDKDKKKAMEETLKNTLLPIMTTGIACLIGFKAMSLGELTMMAEMGDMMSYGVVFCMIAALTLVPSLLVILTKNSEKN